MASTPTNLAKAAVKQTVYENIYDRLVDDVTAVTITGAAEITIKTYTNSFNEKLFDSKSDYPVLIVESISIDSEKDLTMTKKELTGSFTVDIICTQKEAAEKFFDAIKESIETYRSDLRDAGMINVNFKEDNLNDVQREGFMLHSQSVTYDFKFIYTKTRSY